MDGVAAVKERAIETPDKVKALLEKFGITLEIVTWDTSQNRVEWARRMKGGAGIMVLRRFRDHLGLGLIDLDR